MTADSWEAEMRSFLNRIFKNKCSSQLSLFVTLTEGFPTLYFAAWYYQDSGTVQSTDCFLGFFIQNEKGLSPADVVPDPLDVSLEMAESAATAKELCLLLRQALPRPDSPLPVTLQSQAPPPLSDKARVQLAGMGLRLGQCVVIAGQKVGGTAQTRSGDYCVLIQVVIGYQPDTSQKELILD